MSDTITVSLEAKVHADHLHAFIQHIRDFDVLHPGCHFEITAFGTDMPLSEAEAILKAIDPPLPFRQTMLKQ
jgi:hypothetical protein